MNSEQTKCPNCDGHGTVTLDDARKGTEYRCAVCQGTGAITAAPEVDTVNRSEQRLARQPGERPVRYDPRKHYAHPTNGATLRCRACNKYIDRCVCEAAEERPSSDGLTGSERKTP